MNAPNRPLVNIPRFEIALLNSLNHYTSESSRWRPGTMIGQSAIAACVVEDFLGGTIQLNIAELPNGTTDRHYYNRLHDKPGTESYDLTKQPYPEGTIIHRAPSIPEGYASYKDLLLADDARKIRYLYLQEAVQRHLDEHSVL